MGIDFSSGGNDVGIIIDDVDDVDVDAEVDVDVELAVDIFTELGGDDDGDWSGDAFISCPCFASREDKAAVEARRFCLHHL